MQTLPNEVVTFAKQYQHAIVWADKGALADSAALSIGAAAMRSPGGQDANDLLKAGKLEKLLAAMLRKIGATIETTSPALSTEQPAPTTSTAQPGDTDITDYVGATVDPDTWQWLQAEVQRRYAGSWTLYADPVGREFMIRRLTAKPE